MSVYLLHFNQPLAHARHYTGFSKGNPKVRIRNHRVGRGAKLTQAVYAAGITMRVARIWPEGDRAFERELKKNHNAARYCPICQQEKEEKHGFNRSQNAQRGNSTGLPQR